MRSSERKLLCYERLVMAERPWPFLWLLSCWYKKVTVVRPLGRTQGYLAIGISSARVLSGYLESLDFVDREDADDEFAYDLVGIDGPEGSAVQAVWPVIATHKQLV